MQRHEKTKGAVVEKKINPFLFTMLKKVEQIHRDRQNVIRSCILYLGHSCHCTP